MKRLLNFHRALLWVVMLLSVLSCGNRKETVAVEEEAVEVDESANDALPRVVGKVHISESGCLVTIEITAEEETLICYPVNIDDKHKVDGMILKFAWVESRAQQPDGCDVDKVIAVSDVAIMRSSGN